MPESSDYFNVEHLSGLADAVDTELKKIDDEKSKKRYEVVIDDSGDGVYTSQKKFEEIQEAFFQKEEIWFILERTGGIGKAYWFSYKEDRTEFVAYAICSLGNVKMEITDSDEVFVTVLSTSGENEHGDIPYAVLNTPDNYGAAGDGIKDDTQAINDAMRAVSDAGGGTVTFLAKTYLISDTISIPENVVIQGVSKVSEIYMDAVKKTAVLVPGNTGKCGVRNLTIKGNWSYADHNTLEWHRGYVGLQIGTAKSTTEEFDSPDGDVNGLYYSIFDNVDIYGFGTGIRVCMWSWVVRLHMIHIRRCFYGMWNYSTDNYFDTIYISDCPGDGLHVAYSGNCRYTNIMLERCGGAGVNYIDSYALQESNGNECPYYGLNYRGGNNDSFTNVTAIECYGNGMYIQLAKNCNLSGLFAFQNGFIKSKDSSFAKNTYGVIFAGCNGIYGSLFAGNDDSDYQWQTKAFLVYSPVYNGNTFYNQNISIVYGEYNTSVSSSYGGANVRFLKNVDIFGFGSGSDGGSYSLPVASSDVLGGVKPVSKTSDMTQSVGVDSDGRLYTAPGGSGSSDGSTTISTKSDSWYTGKKIVCYGTSITDCGYYYTTPVDGSRWVQAINWRYNGDRKSSYVIKNGKSGYTSAGLAATSCLAENLPSDAKVIIFECGINDWKNSVSITDFKNNLRTIATYMYTNMPSAIIIWFTPHYCLENGSITVGGNTLKQYADAMLEVAEEYNIPCIDMYSKCGWNSINISTYVNDEETEFIHPNHIGGLRIAALVSNMMDQLEPIMTDLDGAESGGGSGEGGSSSGGSDTAVTDYGTLIDSLATGDDYLTNWDATGICWSASSSKYTVPSGETQTVGKNYPFSDGAITPLNDYSCQPDDIITITYSDSSADGSMKAMFSCFYDDAGNVVSTSNDVVYLMGDTSKTVSSGPVILVYNDTDGFKGVSNKSISFVAPAGAKRFRFSMSAWSAITESEIAGYISDFKVYSTNENCQSIERS